MMAQDLLTLLAELLVIGFAILMVIDFVSGLIIIWQEIAVKYADPLPAEDEIPNTIYNFSKILALAEIT